jgi:hypothetical protein
MPMFHQKKIRNSCKLIHLKPANGLKLTLSKDMLFDCLHIKNYIGAEFTAGVISRHKSLRTCEVFVGLLKCAVHGISVPNKQGDHE